MKTLILAAGRFGPTMRASIAEGREPRLDVFELADRMGADLVDYLDADKSRSRWVRAAQERLGASAALALIGFDSRHRYDAILTTGEDIGLPLAALLGASSARCSHTMIAHTLFPRKKRVFFDLLRVERRIDRILAYASSEERLMTSRLRIPAEKVQRIAYHADERFFHPTDAAPEADLLCAAGQLLRDYDTLIAAVRELPVRLRIAAGSPWIDRGAARPPSLPENVEWGRSSRFELRELYRRSALAVVPIFQNEYQTGIATILEMMAMGKCVIATRTRGQTDTITDGVTGIYVPPGDVGALRAAIQRMLDAPEEARRIGAAARRYVEENAGLDRFVESVAEAVRAGNSARLARASAPASARV